MKKLKNLIQSVSALGLLATLSLAGCGGGSSNGGSIGGINTRTFFASAKTLSGGGGTARGYVTMRGDVPTAVGVEISASALANLPTPAPGQAQATFSVPLPSQSAATPFKEIAVAYFASHPPTGVGDVPHFHPLFLLNSPQTPVPPAFAPENAPVAAAEVPADHVRLQDLAPGIGVAYQDPSQPQAKPGWDSYGQNYFFYNGHLNAVALGATVNYLKRLQANTDIARGDVIKQPQIYPKRGLYPQRYTVHFDANRRVHIFELSDFKLKG